MTKRWLNLGDALRNRSWEVLPYLRRASTRRGIGIGLICALVAWLASSTRFAQSFDHSALDALFQLRDERASPSKVFIVPIDEAFFDTFQKPMVEISPELAKVIGYLAEREARSIGVDIILSESALQLTELQPDGPGDAETMGVAVNETARGKVVLSEFFAKSSIVEPCLVWQPVTPSWNDIGYVNLTIDEGDMTLRKQALRAPPPKPPADAAEPDDAAAAPIHPSFGLAIFGKFEEWGQSWFHDARLTLDGRPIPLSNDGKLYVNYVGPPGTIPRIPFSKVLAAANGGPAPEEDLQDAIVLIGGLHPGIADMHATPYANQSYAAALIPSAWIGFEPAMMQGIEVHANVVATLADRAFIHDLPPVAHLALLIVFGVGLGIVMMSVNLETGMVAVVVHHFLWKAAVLAFFTLGNLFAPVYGMLLLGPLVYGAVFALRWRWVRRMMGMFKSEAVARAVEADPRSMQLYGEERQITVLFSDMRNFTSFSEGRQPREVFNLLNHYFSAIVPIIEAHGGVVDKYMGDGIMVLFGAPFQMSDHAYQGLCAARAMLVRVEQLQPLWRLQGAVDFRIGVGVHTGTAITGTLGSPTRLDYTAIGDMVNTASRLESATKTLGVSLLVSQATLDAIPAARRLELNITPDFRQVAVKGKQQTLNVYTLDQTWPDAEDAAWIVPPPDLNDDTKNTWESFL